MSPSNASDKFSPTVDMLLCEAVCECQSENEMIDFGRVASHLDTATKIFSFTSEECAQRYEILKNDYKNSEKLEESPDPKSLHLFVRSKALTALEQQQVQLAALMKLVEHDIATEEATTVDLSSELDSQNWSSLINSLKFNMELFSDLPLRSESSVAEDEIMQEVPVQLQEPVETSKQIVHDGMNGNAETTLGGSVEVPVAPEVQQIETIIPQATTEEQIPASVTEQILQEPKPSNTSEQLQSEPPAEKSEPEADNMDIEEEMLSSTISQTNQEQPKAPQEEQVPAEQPEKGQSTLPVEDKEGAPATIAETPILEKALEPVKEGVVESKSASIAEEIEQKPTQEEQPKVAPQSEEITQVENLSHNEQAHVEKTVEKPQSPQVITQEQNLPEAIHQELQESSTNPEAATQITQEPVAVKQPLEQKQEESAQPVVEQRIEQQVESKTPATAEKSEVQMQEEPEEETLIDDTANVAVVPKKEQTTKETAQDTKAMNIEEENTERIGKRSRRTIKRNRSKSGAEEEVENKKGTKRQRTHDKETSPVLSPEAQASEPIQSPPIPPSTEAAIKTEEKGKPGRKKKLKTEDPQEETGEKTSKRGRRQIRKVDNFEAGTSVTPSAMDEKTRRKLNDIMIKFIKKISAMENSFFFRKPTTSEDAPDFEKVIRRRTDLKTITTQVNQGQISSVADLWRNMLLMFQNSQMYNTKGTNYHCWGTKIRQTAREHIRDLFVQESELLKKEVPQTILNLYPSPASGSNTTSS